MDQLTSTNDARSVERLAETNGLMAIGLDHATAPLALREQLALTPEKRAELTRRLLGEHGCAEVFALSTCLRTEVITVGGERVVEALSAVTGVTESAIGEILQQWETPRDVAERIFRVTSGLESLALGETQIVGQVKRSYESAVEMQGVGPVLHQLIERALATGRRIRSETKVGEGVVSMASLAAHMARHSLGGLNGRRAVIVGTGATAKLCTRHLRDAGVAMTVMTRQGLDRAEEFANQVNAAAAEWRDDLSPLAEADFVIFATNAEEPFINAENLGPVLCSDREHALLLIDLSVPRAVDTDVDDLTRCSLLNIDRMEGKCKHARRRREEALTECDPMIADAVAEFESWQCGQSVKGTIQALQRHLEAMGDDDVTRVVGSVDRAALRKSAHAAITDLRRAAAEGKAAEATAHIRATFQMD